MEIILGFEKLPVTFSTIFFQHYTRMNYANQSEISCSHVSFHCLSMEAALEGNYPFFCIHLTYIYIICRTSSSFYYFELMQWMQVSKSQVSTSHKLACFNYTGTNNLIRLNTQCRSTLSAAVVREDVEGIVWAEAGHLKQVTSKYNPNSLTHCKTKTQPGCELETSRGLIQINRWDRLIWLTWNAS